MSHQKVSYLVTQWLLQKIVKKNKLKELFHSFVTPSVLAVVDQGFPKRVPTPERGDINLLLGKMFAKKCMKMKEIGHGGD